MNITFNRFTDSIAPLWIPSCRVEASGTQPDVSSSAGAGSLYMLSSGDWRLFEVKAFEEDFHSWFVGQAVQRGQFYSNGFI